ncbi:MAG: amidohydrolase family protein [Ferruginibacter sp.]|nr:amidohydrolase family protein [Cytophagales bacterium]
MKYLLLPVLLAATHLLSFAQNPAPAKPQARPVVLVGGTAHLGTGQVIPNAVVAFDQGLLTAVGDASTPYDKTNAEVIDVTGKHVYPGLIAPNSTLGLQEIGAVRSTLDAAEVGGVNPHVRTMIAYNTDSDVIPTVRSYGVLLTQAVPTNGVVAGCSSVMELDGWNWEDAAHKRDDGIHVNWPPFFTTSGFFEGPPTIKKNEAREETLSELDRLFNDAQAYAQLPRPAVTNLKLEAMRGLFDGTKNLYLRASFGKEIIEAVGFAKAHGVKKPVLVGGGQAHLVTEVLKENNVPVILGETHRLPARPEDDVDLPYKQPALLHQAGILVGLSYEGEYWRVRNLPFLAGTAAAYGVSKEEALAMVTANTAKILGIDKTVGTLEKGKHATLVVSGGDLLDMRTNQVEYAFIRGKKLVLDDKQKQLYRKYKDKYGL